jgi:hypothetical protein
MMPEPPSPAHRALLPRVVLIATAVLAALLLLLLWPVAILLRDALAALIQAQGDLIASALLIITLLLALGLVRIVFAFGRRLDAQADVAAIVRLENEHPVHVADVRHGHLHLVERSLEWHYQAEQVRAERSQFPQLSSLHAAIRIEGTAARGAEAPPSLPEPFRASPHRPLLAQLRERGDVCRSGTSLLVGYDPSGQPLSIELSECGFIGVGGQPRVGKTTLVTLLLAQAALLHWHIALGDPHVHKEDGLLQRCAPISGHCFRQATTPDEIAAMIRLVDKIGRRRVQGDADRTPVLLVLDEFTNLVIRKLLPDDVLAALPAMAMEYAGVGVHGIIIGHDWNARLLGGDLGAALRRAITHRLICRSDAQNAVFLLPNAALARQAASLAKGQALYSGSEAPALVSIPRLGTEDLIYAAQGVAPRPYVSRLPTPAPASAPAMPSVPVALPASSVPPRMPVPPTEPLPPPTVPEQIVDLLITRQEWLTSSEIAQALAIDLKVIQTELTPLSRQRAIRRRPVQRNVPEKYEYAAQSPQLLNAPMAVSA